MLRKSIPIPIPTYGAIHSNPHLPSIQPTHSSLTPIYTRSAQYLLRPLVSIPRGNKLLYLDLWQTTICVLLKLILRKTFRAAVRDGDVKFDGVSGRDVLIAGSLGQDAYNNNNLFLRPVSI